MSCKFIIHCQTSRTTINIPPRMENLYNYSRRKKMDLQVLYDKTFLIRTKPSYIILLQSSYILIQ